MFYQDLVIEELSFTFCDLIIEYIRGTYMISIRFVLQLKGFHQGNYNGEFVCAFASNLGVCLIVKVELWAILIAIILALSRGFSKLSVECGSATAINMINSGVCVHHLCYTLCSVQGRFYQLGNNFEF